MQQIEYLSLVFEVPLEDEDSLQGYFLLNYDPQGFEEQSNGSFVVHLLKTQWNDDSKQNLSAFLATLNGRITLVDTITQATTDWNAQWEASIEPLRISEDLMITPSWKLEEANASGATFQIVIDPKMSFGTGHHETTRLCLKMIEHIVCTDKSILDLGSGTGILALYAMMRGSVHAIAVDTDEWAFENSKENCERNGYGSKKIELRLGKLSTVVSPEEQFDILIANIHRNVLLTINNQIADHQRSGGVLILSGLLEYDADEVIEAYQASGYQLQERLQENEWVCLRFSYNGWNANSCY